MKYTSPETKWRSLFAVPMLLALIAGTVLLSSPSSAQKKKIAKLGKPSLSCAGSTINTISVTFTAGTNGAPAGFSVQWMTAADFAANGSQWPANSDCPLDINGNPTCPGSFCKASFSGTPSTSTYGLPAGGTRTVEIGNLIDEEVGVSFSCDDQELECGTSYVFRAFSHANGSYDRSDYSDTQTCATSECPPPSGGSCTHVHADGYWKEHTSEWNTGGSLTIGGTPYSDADLLTILNRPGQGNNGLLALAHELIASELNILNGCHAPNACTTAAVASADAKMVGYNLLTDSAAKAYAEPERAELHDYNSGQDPQCP